MIDNALNKQEINTDADASVRGIELQKLRATNRLLKALQENKKAIFCTIEHVDDVLEVELGQEKTNYTAEQNKLYESPFSMNSHEVKNSLRIFFDTWIGTVEESESIAFLFYTNTYFVKENKVGVLKAFKELPEESLIELLIQKRFDEALPFVLPIFKAYYLEQHKKHSQNLEIYEQIIEGMTTERWKKFFGLIEWNFGDKNDKEVRNEIDERVIQLCQKFNVELRYANMISAELIDMISKRMSNQDLLEKVVHVAEVKVLFLELAQDIKVQEKLDPGHLRWDEIECGDIRNIEDKILSVCPDYDKDLLIDYNDAYVDGAFEQQHSPELRAVKAYNYRVFTICKQIIRKAKKEKHGEFSQEDINHLLEKLTDETEKMIVDKSKTYKMPFLDRDMAYKAVLILFQECYIALD